jgi:ferredoxin
MMKKIIIKPGCITCGTCAFLAPNVFEVTDISHVKTTADLEKNKEQIKDAMQQCPMQVITYEE